MDYAAASREAVAALRRGDRAKVAAVVGDLIAADAPLGEQWAPVARMAAAIGEIGQAIEAMRRHMSIDPGDPERRLAQLAMLAESGRIEEAIELGEPFANRWPENAPIRHLLGTAHAQMGNQDAARGHLLAALRIWPNAGATWLALVSLQKQNEDSPDFAALLNADTAVRAANGEARAAYCYALGKGYDDIGEREKALAAFAEGAALVRPARRYDPAADSAAVDRSLAGFTATELAELAARTPSEPGRAIFVVGLPRSGTTLVEQMLVSHEAVVDGGEVNLLAHVARQLGGATAARLRAFAGSDDRPEGPWRPLAQLYRHLLDERFGPNGRVVDKTLSNTRLIGLIRLILPDAPIVWVRRDPIDSAWSSFRTFFAKGARWSWSPIDIAHHYAAEERGYRHWRAVAGDRLLTLDYADLVTDPDRWIPALLQHCGLDEQAQVHRFHETRRAVTTSSLAQVRRPLHRDAIGIAPEYRAFMEPFVREFERLTA